MLGWCTCELLSECSCTSRPTSRSALTTLCPSPPPRYALLFSLLQHSCVSLNLSPSVFRLLFSRATHAARARVLFFMLLFATSPRPTDACRFSLFFFCYFYLFFFMPLTAETRVVPAYCVLGGETPLEHALSRSPPVRTRRAPHAAPRSQRRKRAVQFLLFALLRSCLLCFWPPHDDGVCEWS